jgi:RNA polymerase sigma-70 factor, ECF subfamily
VAYEHLVRRHQHVAYRVACVYARSPSEAEEAVQEALINAWRHLARYDPSRATFRAWLLAIVANQARSGRRSEARWTARTERAGAALGGSDDAGPSSDPQRLQRERSRELLSALERLRASEREVILLRYGLDLSERELSDVLGCRPGTVKSRLSRAMDRLREVMSDG